MCVVRENKDQYYVAFPTYSSTKVKLGFVLNREIELSDLLHV